MKPLSAIHPRELLKSWGWTPGRQGSGYLKFKLCALEPYFDAYILRYPTGSQIPAHRDPVEGRAHYRLNLVLWRPTVGGEFQCHSSIFQGSRVTLFRPDLHVHSVSPIQEGSRLVLSLGMSRRSSNIASRSGD